MSWALLVLGWALVFIGGILAGWGGPAATSKSYVVLTVIALVAGGMLVGHGLEAG